MSVLRSSQPPGPPGVVGSSSARVVTAHCLHLHLLGNLLPLLLHDLLHRFEPVLPQLDPLVGVAHTGVLNHGTEHHEEAHEEIDVDGLHVGDLWQSGVDGVDEGGHGEDRGDAQSYPGRSCSSVEPEGDPGHHHDQTARDVNLNCEEYSIWSVCIMFNTGLII